MSGVCIGFLFGVDSIIFKFPFHINLLLAIIVRKNMTTSVFVNIIESVGKSLSHTISEDEVVCGDHLYCYRALYTFSHHGIYCGKWKDVRGSILHQINQLHSKENLEFYQRLKQSSSFFAEKKEKNDNDERKDIVIISSPSSKLSHCQSISDILDSVNNKKSILLSICDKFKPNDGIVIHLSGTTETGPLIQPCTLNEFINEGIGSYKCMNILKRVRYNCNMFAFYIKRSGSCSNEKMCTDRNITVVRAINALGWDEYDVTGFNCESFCVYCKIEKPISYQAETLLSINDFIEETGRITKNCVDFIADKVQPHQSVIKQ